MSGACLDRASRLLAIALLVGGLPALADAQVWIGSAGPRPGSVEITGGGNWTGSQTFPVTPASLTVNPSGGLSSFDQFTSEASIDAAFGVHGNVGVYITRALAIEGGVQFSRPQLSVQLSDDFEDAPDVTATATMTSYVFRGSLIYHFGSGQTVPFVGGGAGYVRGVHAGNELIESNVEYHGLAGIKMWFNPRRKAGFRAEGGFALRGGGFGTEDERRMVPIAAASLLYLF